MSVPINQIQQAITIPHSLLYALLHHIGLLWLQQDHLYHLPSHQGKQLPRHNIVKHEAFVRRSKYNKMM